MSATAQTSFFGLAELLLPALGSGRLVTERFCTPVRETAERDLMRSFKPTTYLTIEEIRQIASAKFEEATALPDGPQRQQLLKSAYSFRSLAEMKSWLSSDLQPPS